MTEKPEKIEYRLEKKKIYTDKKTKAPKDDWETYVDVGHEKWAEDLVEAALKPGVISEKEQTELSEGTKAGAESGEISVIKNKIQSGPPAHLPVERPPALIIPRQEAEAAKKTAESVAEAEPVAKAEKKTPEEIKSARQAAVNEMTKEEQVGELERNLKSRYAELFTELKNKKDPAKEIYENIQEDQNELAQLYGPEIRAKVIKIFDAIKESFKGKDEKINELVKIRAGDFEMRLDLYKKLLKGRKAEQAKKDEIYRSELGLVFNKIKLEAMEETGYKAVGVQKIKAKEQKPQAGTPAVIPERIKGASDEEKARFEMIEKGKKLMEKYGIKNRDDFEKFKKYN